LNHGSVLYGEISSQHTARCCLRSLWIHRAPAACHGARLWSQTGTPKRMCSTTATMRQFVCNSPQCVHLRPRLVYHCVTRSHMICHINVVVAYVLDTKDLLAYAASHCDLRHVRSHFHLSALSHEARPGSCPSELFVTGERPQPEGNAGDTDKVALPSTAAGCRPLHSAPSGLAQTRLNVWPHIICAKREHDAPAFVTFGDQ
jgi:hypothetical protein